MFKESVALASVFFSVVRTVVVEEVVVDSASSFETTSDKLARKPGAPRR